MAYQHMPKIFHGPHKNPPPPSYILNVLSLKKMIRKLFTTNSNRIVTEINFPKEI